MLNPDFVVSTVILLKESSIQGSIKNQVFKEV